MRSFVVCRSSFRPFCWLTLGLALTAMTCRATVAAGSNDAALDAKTQRAVALFKSIVWQEGPSVAKLGAIAEITVPEGYRFTGQDGPENGRS